MKLAGDLAEFSLADLVQVAGVAGRVCCIRVMTAEGNGALYLEGGEVVGASYENLTGFDALVALVASRAGHFQVEDGGEPLQRTPLGGVQRLLLEVNARIESGDVPRPQARRRAPVAAEVPAGAPGRASERRRPSHWIVGGAATLLLLGALSWLALARRDTAAARSAGADPLAIPIVPAAPESAVEATQLTAAGDAMPTLAAGDPPASPDPDTALKPTVVCRLLVDTSGHVADAKVYRSRLDLARFEDAAVDAVRKYRFTPGRRAGKTVPVWINWPVTFR